ncbi:uncharacterized protein METZ01_LOCUS454215 [marine metagenome]|uniref:Uncharacterized protein n=1 Tax=marine metagenome TaxID=408172 RepID=A0A383A112_9ZZZZ
MSDYHNKIADQDYRTSDNCSIIIAPLNCFPCFYTYRVIHKLM